MYFKIIRIIILFGNGTLTMAVLHLAAALSLLRYRNQIRPKAGPPYRTTRRHDPQYQYMNRQGHQTFGF
jgi:hypothetical protein